MGKDSLLEVVAWLSYILNLAKPPEKCLVIGSPLISPSAMITHSMIKKSLSSSEFLAKQVWNHKVSISFSSVEKSPYLSCLRLIFLVLDDLPKKNLSLDFLFS